MIQIIELMRTTAFGLILIIWDVVSIEAISYTMESYAL